MGLRSREMGGLEPSESALRICPQNLSSESVLRICPHNLTSESFLRIRPPCEVEAHCCNWHELKTRATIHRDKSGELVRASTTRVLQHALPQTLYLPLHDRHYPCVFPAAPGTPARSRLRGRHPCEFLAATRKGSKEVEMPEPDKTTRISHPFDSHLEFDGFQLWSKQLRSQRNSLVILLIPLPQRPSSMLHTPTRKLPESQGWHHT